MERLLDEANIESTLDTLAQSIADAFPLGADTAIVGIQQRGVPLARRLAARLASDDVPAPPVGVLDIALYRDDMARLSRLPVVRPTRLPFDPTDKRILLVDDVIFTGRTIRAAIDELMDYGRPRVIKLAVLVDRGCRELPIQPDFVGLRHEVDSHQRVFVRVKDIDGREEVTVE